jgi:hypothetical protein
MESVMDNRTDVTEDFQSTPEHLADQVGGLDATKAADAQATATPGALRQAILDAEHDENAASREQSHAQRWSGSRTAELGRWNAARETWRSRAMQPIRGAAMMAAQHPFAFALLAIGVAVGAAAFMHSRSGAR